MTRGSVKVNMHRASVRLQKLMKIMKNNIYKKGKYPSIIVCKFQIYLIYCKLFNLFLFYRYKSK